VNEENKVYEREYDWKLDVPYEGAVNLRCKYVVKANANLPSKSTGFLYIQLEQYGFDEDVFVIV